MGSSRQLVDALIDVGGTVVERMRACLLEGDTPRMADTNVYFLALVMVWSEARERRATALRRGLLLSSLKLSS